MQCILSESTMRDFYSALDPEKVHFYYRIFQVSEIFNLGENNDNFNVPQGVWAQIKA